MRSLFRFRQAALLLAALPSIAGLSGCHFLRGDAENLPVQVVEVRRGNVCGTVDGVSHVNFLADAAAAQAWQGANGFKFANTDSLAPGRYLLVEMGSRPTGGYSFAVSRKASLSEGELQLTAVYLSPTPGRMINQMVSSPCALLVLPVTRAPIRRAVLFDAAGTVLADSQPPGAPEPAARLSIPELKSDPDGE